MPHEPPQVPKMQAFTQSTLVPIAWIAAIVAPTLAVGMLFQQVTQLSQTVQELKSDIKTLASIQTTTFYTDYDSVRDFCTKFVRTINP